MGRGNLVLLVPKVTLLVHPVDTSIHSTIPPGFRWAVMLGDGRHDDMGCCAEARWCPTEHEASLEGEMVAVAVAKALRMFGVPIQPPNRVVLDHDPIPAGGDTVSLG